MFRDITYGINRGNSDVTANECLKKSDLVVSFLKIFCSWSEDSNSSGCRTADFNMQVLEQRNSDFH